jgi:hypothetical protein
MTFWREGDYDDAKNELTYYIGEPVTPFIIRSQCLVSGCSKRTSPDDVIAAAKLVSI